MKPDRALAGPAARRCAATGEVRPRAALLRFALQPDGTLVPDAEGRMGGRGVWVSADRGAIARAAQRGGFAKAARRAVRAGEDPAGAAEAALAAAVMARLGRLARAGRARPAPDGAPRLRVVAAEAAAGAGECIACLTAAEIAAATGRPAPLDLADGPATRAFAALARRLTGVRGGPKAAPSTGRDADVNFRPAIRSAGQAGDR